METPQNKREQDEFDEAMLDFSIDKKENIFDNQKNYAIKIYSLAIRHERERAK